MPRGKSVKSFTFSTLSHGSGSKGEHPKTRGIKLLYNTNRGITRRRPPVRGRRGWRAPSPFLEFYRGPRCPVRNGPGSAVSACVQGSKIPEWSKTIVAVERGQGAFVETADPRDGAVSASAARNRTGAMALLRLCPRRVRWGRAAAAACAALASRSSGDAARPLRTSPPSEGARLLAFPRGCPRLVPRREPKRLASARAPLCGEPHPFRAHTRYNSFDHSAAPIPGPLGEAGAL